MNDEFDYDEFIEKAKTAVDNFVSEMDSLTPHIEQLSQSYEKMAARIRVLADAMIDEEETSET